MHMQDPFVFTFTLSMQSNISIQDINIHVGKQENDHKVQNLRKKRRRRSLHWNYYQRNQAPWWLFGWTSKNLPCPVSDPLLYILLKKKKLKWSYQNELGEETRELFFLLCFPEFVLFFTIWFHKVLLESNRKKQKKILKNSFL